MNEYEAHEGDERKSMAGNDGNGSELGRLGAWACSVEHGFSLPLPCEFWILGTSGCRCFATLGWRTDRMAEFNLFPSGGVMGRFGGLPGQYLAVSSMLG